jgi:nucleoside-diphosphate-sugar epimerase
VAAALLVIAEQRASGVINVGTGFAVGLGELSRLICMRLGISDLGEFAPDPSNVPKDIVIADSEKLRALGWKPRYDIRSGIDSFFEIDDRKSNRVSRTAS